MSEDRIFQVSWVKGYGLRLALVLVPALLTVFAEKMGDMLSVLGVGFILSGALQWFLAARENPVFLSTMWTVNRARLQPGRRAKSERERKKQLAERRRQVIERAKGEGKTLAVVFAILGAGLILAGGLFF